MIRIRFHKLTKDNLLELNLHYKRCKIKQICQTLAEIDSCELKQLSILNNQNIVLIKESVQLKLIY